jgi:uncharacterized membrane protein
MSLVAVLLAWIMYELDFLIPNEALQTSRVVLSGTAADGRTMLVSMAATILGTAGVVFSLLTLPLSTVAAQYGSRLLCIFLGDRTTQFVLGMFVGTFVYCFAAALSILPAELEPEGPQLTVTVGLYLMLATFASLILLIQHISTMLQAPNIAASAGAELLDIVRMEILYEGANVADQSKTDRDTLGALKEAEAYPVRLGEAGYIQYIDPEYMLTLAHEQDFVIRLLLKPGGFVRQGSTVAQVWPASRVDKRLDQRLRRAFQVGNMRTPTQDTEYAINQLVEVAVRAMSPAINDPFTAMTCLDHIGNGLALFVQQGRDTSYIHDRDGKLRLIFEPVTFAGLLCASFDMLRHASCDNATVLIHLLETIEAIGQETKSSEARQELLRHVHLVQADSQAGALVEQDKHRINMCYKRVETKLNLAG